MERFALRKTIRRTSVGVLICVFAFGVTFGPGCSRDSSIDRQESQEITVKLQTGYQLHQQGRSDEALQIVKQALIASPGDKDALALAIEIHASLGQFCAAASLASELAEFDIANAATIFVRAFDWNLQCGDYPAAEANLNRAVELSPHDVDVRRLLAQLLNAQGRRFEASEHVLELIRLRAASPDEVLSLIDLSGPFSLASFDELVDRSQTTLFELGEARRLHVALHANPTEVIQLLRRITEKFPHSAAAAAFHGRVLAEVGRFDELRTWFTSLPGGIEQQPEYWFAYGQWLATQNQHREAVRAFGEAVRRDPSDRESLRSMIGSLDAIGNADQARAIRERLAVLDKIFRIARDADADEAAWIADRLYELARPWESVAWLMQSTRRQDASDTQRRAVEMRYAAVAAWEQNASIPQIQEARLQRILGFDITDFPLANIAMSPRLGLSRDQAADATINLRFEDVAAQRQLTTRFHSGFPLDGGEFYPHQVNGGGLAVFDYDLDGKCDLYLSQSGGLPNDPQGSMANQLFRLGIHDNFVETTGASGTGDRGFGQGVCAGDVNQDGFVDLLIGNIGMNVLYINQGDGTFIDGSYLLSDNSQTWTSSIGLADLNGDGLPELIEINYIDDPQAYTTHCSTDYLPCTPQRFSKAPDRIFRCSSDGRFEPWGDYSTAVSPKLGFGMVVANFDRQNGNDFFVSNDGDLNHFWSSVPASQDSSHRYELVESAGVRGCSVGRGGNSQACMGIASGDFDRNATLDLHVTNFYHEPVNLFLQNQSGFFSDEALKFGLTEPSFDVLGFGTQSADFNNDGWLDLAVLNGHVFDARDPAIPFRMRPQLFSGGSQGFSLHPSSSSGAYWETHQLGRTLALLDWNRDGRMDLLANHLDTPVALLENVSDAEHWLQVEVIGVESERDAIGAEVRIEAGGEQWTGWSTGGDGYMCTNEPVIHFGLGDLTKVERMEIRWPSGKLQTFNDVPIDSRVLAIEGDGKLFLR
ncbi:MAG: FG-GAP-like repeat-containing protein [Planctomycetaceae bacterium]